MPAPIPLDLQADILVRLPVKSLLRFRCVSRSWKSLISSSGFISRHNEITDNYFHLLHQYDYDQGENIGTYEFNDSFIEFRSTELSSQVRVKRRRFVLDCNGLILFPCEHKGCILWNPSVRKSMILPRPCIEVREIFDTVYGFGFDHGSNDYKVLRIVPGQKVGHSNMGPLRAEFYSLQTGAWKTVRVDEDFRYHVGDQRQSFVNGACHWLGFNTSHDWFGLSRDLVAVVFDMCNEEFRLMKLPDRLTGCFLPAVCLGVSGGLLSLINYPWRPEGFLSCSVWLLKEYGVVGSWTICATIDLSDWGGFRRSLFSLRNKDEILLTRGKMLVLFDLKTHRLTDLGIKIRYDQRLTMNTYKESLVLLNEDRPASEDWCFCSKERMGLEVKWGWLRKVH